MLCNTHLTRPTKIKPNKIRPNKIKQNLINIAFNNCHVRRATYSFIISFTLILAADWSIAVGYWTVFHCFSLLVNFRMGISVLSSLLKSRLNVLSSFAMVTMVDLKFTGHSLVVFYITRHTRRIKNKIKKLKLKKKLN